MTSDPSQRTVSPLRARMIEGMTVRGLNERTHSHYVRHVRAFAAFIGRSPDTATAEDLRLFQRHQTRSEMQPPSVCRVSTLRDSRGVYPRAARSADPGAASSG